MRADASSSFASVASSSVSIVVLGALIFCAITAPFARTRNARAVFGFAAAAAATTALCCMNGQLSFLDAGIGVLIGYCTASGHVLVQYLVTNTTAHTRTVLLIAGGGSTGFLLFLWLLSKIPDSDDQLAREAAASELHELAHGNFVSGYNVLHPRLKENVSFVETLPLLQRLQPLFARARIKKVVITNDWADADVFCTLTEGGTKHQLVLKQEHFSGLTRVTDGHMESLMNYTNAITIGDVLIDGKSIFPDLPRAPTP